ncbi:hypothetical protein [Lacticaseibacillus daqingensis]|uniref:hypothetical protein n=1 Tax=Lacticaseibacillus daqingensis TaxID=2486014 RepID=UPI000F7B453A|nr:hypothetical protein [Lacticaseibacillus daqingensis]
MPEIDRNGQTHAEVKKSRNAAWIEKEFAASVFLFFIKGKISVDYRGVHVTEQNTVLGLIPAGQRKQTIPLNNISAATINTAYVAKRFIWGFLIALFGLMTISNSPFVGLLFAALGVITFLNGIMTTLSIEKSGNTYVLNVPFFNKTDIMQVQDVIEQALNTAQDKTDQSLYHKRLAEDEMSEID